MHLAKALTALLFSASLLTPAAPQQEMQRPVRFNRIVKGSDLIAMSVMDAQNKPLGHVAEVVIDHRNGYLAVFGIRQTGAPEGHLMLVPPIRTVFKAKEGYIQLTQPLSSYSTQPRTRVDQIEREQMAAIYTASQSKPYWGENRYGLVTLDDLDGRIVRGKDWKKLGRIQDVAFAPERNWLVAYNVLAETSDHSKHNVAAPMWLFSRARYSPTWTILAPAEVLSKLPKFKDRWPRVLPRDWVETASVTSRNSSGHDLRN